ncbi:hypothetical protein PVAP13_5NG359000 [Panicum virgatum]|uniref:Uncharacterized protein n=1 Tax=Panicum virgatum TaxID=38727 RepID=A0A8T0RVB1_PANVG|nr:hypothetical protein PVAP13_5NG359000 [Panicum virgatum]
MASLAMLLEASVEATLSTLRTEAPQRRAQPFTIFRVPAYVREGNPTAYELRMVSISPYYHGAAALRAMEDHKWLYLHDLLSRNATVSSSLLIQEMRSLEPRACACYSERPLLSSDDFVRMLLLDGCFILEFFFKWHTKEPDALCDVDWGLILVNADLLLLENQVPFFVVERLHDQVAGAQGGRSDEVLIEPPFGTCEIHHLLHLYYENFVPRRPPVASSSSRLSWVIPRTTQMRAAGVSFVRRRSARDSYDVAFDGRRCMMGIPSVMIDGAKRPLLVNLIAFEQSLGMEETRVLTSYVSLMGLLVRGAQDVELLRRRSILKNLLADDEEAAHVNTQFFARLGEGGGTNYNRHVFAGLYEDVQSYCGSWWHRNKATLRRKYFGSPWSAISFIVAGLVVALTATQTYFTVFPRS